MKYFLVHESGSDSLCNNEHNTYYQQTRKALVKGGFTDTLLMNKRKIKVVVVITLELSTCLQSARINFLPGEFIRTGLYKLFPRGNHRNW